MITFWIKAQRDIEQAAMRQMQWVLQRLPG
jgi:hypothetical protein